MIVAVADTHALIWNLFDDRRLSQVAKDFIDQAAAEGNQIAISSITLAEMVYLIEKNRIPSDTMRRSVALLAQHDSPLAEVQVNRDICQQMMSIPRGAVPELPDRIIAASALHLGVPVISRDHKIRMSGLITIW